MRGQKAATGSSRSPAASATGTILGWGVNTLMDYRFIDGRLFGRHTDEERKPLLQRLNRIEGQVRVVRRMIE